jgi:cytochrome c oxidase subunit 2
MVDDTINLTFIVTGVAFVAVNLFMAYVIVRYRHREGSRAVYEPENKKLEWWLIGGTTLAVIAMLAPGLSVWGKIIDAPEDAAIVEVVGQQWQWSYRFPGEDGELGKVDSRLVSDDNPFGMDAEDPLGLDDLLVSGNEVHLPLDQPVKLLLRSKDVLHNFTVAQFRVKMDLVPGMVPYIWLTPTRPGKFDIFCEELCGVGHFAMRGHVVVEDKDDFESWLGNQPTFAQTLVPVVADAVAGKALYDGACVSCHGDKAQGNIAMNAPKLSGQSDWYMSGQLTNFKKGIRGAHENDLYGRQMAAMATLLVDEEAVNNVVAYINSQPDERSSPTLTQPEKNTNGARLYTTCGACHGNNGQGIEAMKAPRLAGMNDWYLVTQLNNFKTGVRGKHGQDKYGPQMALLTSMLKNDQDINDVAAHINTLRIMQ